MVFPALTTEIAVGQFFRKSIPEIMELYSRKWKGIAFLELYVCATVGSYYIYLMTYAFVYMFDVIFGRIDYLDSPQNLLLTNIQTFFNEKILNNNYDVASSVQ